ncbi:hypothetical protein L9F63_022978, partial [Diploptera punctata]
IYAWLEHLTSVMHCFLILEQARLPVPSVGTGASGDFCPSAMVAKNIGIGFLVLPEVIAGNESSRTLVPDGLPTATRILGVLATSERAAPRSTGDWGVRRAAQGSRALADGRGGSSLAKHSKAGIYFKKIKCLKAVLLHIGNELPSIP